ncbi:hypothetical protein CAPTEDRAFT_209557 [Capitella teleta]|uniref:SSD domain-containing protein n=1 Tax=Capitella teleta TaxID=283909 RepID=R7UKR6_CAPTE|nr:hypothetical protein CAPTEDRAFT_209557 [Capitella teleta]|eukprot:ELU03862.1 hypothetical protein CAPTEDRAFT_209557 [Capitella teleta]
MEDDVEKAFREQREKKPLLFCKWLVQHPKKLFFLFLVGHILFLLITFVLARVGYNIIPISFGRLPLNILDDEDFLRSMAWTERDDGTDIIARGTFGSETLRSVPRDFVSLFFRREGHNVFTKENLQLIKAVEDDFYQDATFQADFCLLSAAGTCFSPSSVLRFFDGTYMALDPVFNDPNFDNIVAVLHKANTLNQTKVALQRFLGRDASITATEAISEITRCSLTVGYPLDGVIFDFRYFGIFHVLGIFIILGIGADDLFVFYDNWKTTGFYQYPSLAHRLSDCYRKASLAMFFTSLTTGTAFIISAFSPFLAINSFGLFCGLLILVNYISVIVFFPSVVVMYHLYFEKFKCCCCCPVANSVVHNSQSNGAGSENQAYVDETGAAVPEVSYHNGSTGQNGQVFIVQAAHDHDSPNLPSVEERVVLNATDEGPSILNEKRVVLNQVEEPKVAYDNPPQYVGSEKAPLPQNPVVAMPENYKNRESGHQKLSEKNFVIRFMAGPFFTFITHKIARWVILACMAVLTCIFIYFCSQLRVNEEQTKFLPDDSNAGKYLSWNTNLFSTSGDNTNNVQVYLIWGLKVQDISSCHKTDFECTGNTVWDSNFNLDSATTQQALKDICSELKTLDEATKQSLAIKPNFIDQSPEVACFLDDMEEFYAPITQPLRLHMLMFTSLQFLMDSLVTSLGLSRHRLESPIGFTTHSQVSGNSQWSEYSSHLGEATDIPYTQTVTTPVAKGGETYKYGTKLRYVAIVVNTTLERATLSYPEGLPVRDAWEDWLNAKRPSLPVELKGVFQATPTWDSWHGCTIQKVLVSSAVQGILIGLGVVLVVLICATRNIIVGLLGTLTICLITICVVGMIPLAGWKLGLLESLNLVLVVGLSVDYVVHLAEGYSRSKYTDRLGRVQHMLEEVGISVISGACTTLGASLFLLFAKILFFTEFGVFLFSTIGLSILFALMFFCTILGIIGPENDTGKLSNILKCCRKK